MTKITSKAWTLHKGEGDGTPGELVFEDFTFDNINDNEVLVEPLFGCWEGNMSHAVDRRPVDIALQRGEDKVVIGNAGLVRILEKGAKVNTCQIGDICIVFCVGITDKWGYPIRIMGYDAPGTMGVLSRVSKMPGHSVIPIPKNTKYTLGQWAAFSLRYVTAWANHKIALRCWRSQMETANPNEEWVLAWGGGVSFAQGILAKNDGFNVIMVSSGDERLANITKEGMHPIDRRHFADMQYDPTKYASEKEFKRRYIQAENHFIEEVHRISGGKDMAMVVDYIGLPVYRISLKILGRQGVITTAGWKEGMVLTNYRALECIHRHIHVHTHYANYSEGVEAVEYAEKHGWLPEILPNEIYHFTDIPRLKEDYDNNILSYFPIFKINEV